MSVLHQLVDAVEVDDVRAVNADELAWVEQDLNAAEDLTVQVRAADCVNGYVHAVRGNPSNVRDLDDMDPAAILERESV